jgi:hypothetical protein
MSAPVGSIVDHRDHNTLNNRRSTNLRFVTHTQNSANSTRTSSSGYRGVAKHKPKRNKQFTYFASISNQSIKHHLGTYASPIEAAVAYDNAARKMFGEHAILNFPDIHRDPIGRIEKFTI